MYLIIDDFVDMSNSLVNKSCLHEYVYVTRASSYIHNLNTSTII